MSQSEKEKARKTKSAPMVAASTKTYHAFCRTHAYSSNNTNTTRHRRDWIVKTVWLYCCCELLRLRTHSMVMPQGLRQGSSWPESLDAPPAVCDSPDSSPPSVMVSSSPHASRVVGVIEAWGWWW